MGVSPRVFLKLRRTHKYREPAHEPFSFHRNAGNYKNRSISLWHNPLGFFSWGRHLKIHTEIKTESFQEKKCVGRSKLTLSVTLIRVTCLQILDLLWLQIHQTILIWWIWYRFSPGEWMGLTRRQTSEAASGRRSTSSKTKYFKLKALEVGEGRKNQFFISNKFSQNYPGSSHFNYKLKEFIWSCNWRADRTGTSITFSLSPQQ